MTTNEIVLILSILVWDRDTDGYTVSVWCSCQFSIDIGIFTIIEEGYLKYK